ncbi:hypothetical protein EMPS_08071 [Entomortierella parvispora]|uniref:tRNA-binding domain-containing protein n=1 Tax=Entomortierella parvispora TaxID=205924 RepID=A0A9P3LZ18_9FUNG|nr:hypothetical protein EMPS_08071 [Entomortierella parvispora]
MVLDRQQRRMGHTWISGHPHNILYKPSSSTGGNKASNISCASAGHSSAASSSSACGALSFLDFAGNSRYQAYNLARFSTLSAVSSTSSSSSVAAAWSSKPLEHQGPSTNTPAPGSSQGQQDPLVSQNHVGSDSKSDADGQSLISSSPASAPLVSDNSAPVGSADTADDKDDAWAVNESYSGHGGTIPPPSSSKLVAPSSGPVDGELDDQESYSTERDPSDVSSRELRPSLSSFKSPVDIEASWRQTSDSIPSQPSSNPTITSSSLSSNKPGSLDLSSSTLVQQMLFKERPPHKTDGNGDWEKSEEELTSKDNSTSLSPEETPSPSLTSMVLNLSSMESTSSAEEAVSSRPKTINPTASKTAQDNDDHVAKLDLRVGIVRTVANHPDAESLYIEQVDLGDDNEGGSERTIVSGLVKHVPKEYLEGRAVIVVGNMKPSKLRGVLSQGMLLCAMEQGSNGEVTKVGLLEPAEGSQAGDKVTLEGYTDADTIPAPVLTPKRKWFEKSREHFSVRDGVAYYKETPFKTGQGLVRCRSISNGQIS